MKRWQKTMLIVAAILIAAGVAITIIALVLGATFREAVSSGLFSHSVDELVSDAPKGIEWNSKIADDGHYEISEPIHSICIDWMAGSAELIPGENGMDAVILEESGKWTSNDEALRYGVLDGTLYIEYCRREGRFRNLPEKTLHIQIPAELASSLQVVELDAVSSDVTLEGLSAQEFSLNSVSGNLTCKDLTASDLDLETVSGIITVQGSFAAILADATSGDVEITAANTTREASVSTVSGSIAISGEISELDAESTSGDVTISCGTELAELDIDTTSADVSLTIPESLGFELEFHTASGELDAKLPLVMEGEQLRYGDGSTEIEISTTSGDLNLYSLQ